MPLSRFVWGRVFASRPFGRTSLGQLVPELPEQGLFGLGEAAIGHGVGYSLLTALFEGFVDGVPVPVGAASYLG